MQVGNLINKTFKVIWDIQYSSMFYETISILRFGPRFSTILVVSMSEFLPANTLEESRVFLYINATEFGPNTSIRYLSENGVPGYSRILLD
jgi:hypothetical protein